MTTEPNFDRFVEALVGTNPFIKARVTDTDRDEGTVAAIHEGKLHQLTSWVTKAAAEPTSVGVMLLGSAGVGKSHLLARLAQWGRDDHATVVYLHNVLASPELMLRYVLQALVSTLVAGPTFAESPLYTIVKRALLKDGGFKPRLGDRSGTSEAIQKLGKQVDPQGLVIGVLDAFVSSASAGSDHENERARAAASWLAGQTLDEAEAALLAVKDRAARLDLPDDASVERVIHVIARLAALAELPLVLCLDQIDNLHADAARSLTSYAHALLDRSHHLVVVVSGNKQTLLKMKDDGVISAASWDRVADRKLELLPVLPAEARAMVQRRIDNVIGVFEEKRVPEVVEARGRDRLFPLGTAWFDERAKDVIEIRPREIVLWARERWEAQQEVILAVGGRRWFEAWPKDPRAPKKDPPSGRSGGETVPAPNALIDAEVRKKFVEAVQQRGLQRASLPPDADNVASLAYVLLSAMAGNPACTLVSIERVPAKKRGPAPAYQLVAKEKRADGVIVTSGVTFVSTTSAQSAGAALARMADDPSPPNHRILVTDEEQRPLKRGGKGQAVYDALCKLGRERFQHIRLDFVRHAELDALAGVLAAARSQDLEIEEPRGTYRRLTEAEVLASFQRQTLLLGHPLLRELLTEDLADQVVEEKSPLTLDAQRTREELMAEIVWRVGMTTKEFAGILQRRDKLPEARFADVWAQVKSVARGLHAEGRIHLTAQDDDFFVQGKGKSRASGAP